MRLCSIRTILVTSYEWSTLIAILVTEMPVGIDFGCFPDSFVAAWMNLVVLLFQDITTMTLRQTWWSTKDGSRPLRRSTDSTRFKPATDSLDRITVILTNVSCPCLANL